MKKNIILLRSDIKFIVVPREIDTMLGLLYSLRSSEMSVKIRMIKLLKLASCLLPDGPYNLSSCKEYIEENWDFDLIKQ